MTNSLLASSVLALATQMVVRAEPECVDFLLCKEAESITFSNEFLEKYNDSSNEDCKKDSIFAWEFKNFHEITEEQKRDLSRVSEQLKFSPIKIQALFERNHLCVVFKFKKESDNFAILIIPGVPENAGVKYTFKECKGNVILVKKPSTRFRVRGFHEIFVEK